MLLILSLITQPLLRRISETEELARQRGVDLENLAQLNQYIIQNLREALLVVDQESMVRLINQAAMKQLERPDVKAGDRLDVFAPRVNRLLIDWRAGRLEETAAQFKYMGNDGTVTILGPKGQSTKLVIRPDGSGKVNVGYGKWNVSAGTFQMQ